MFRIDPVTVLDSDTTEWLVRYAAFQVIVADEKREAERRKRR